MDSTDRDRRWERAKRRIAASQLCFDQGYYAESVTLSYYACYQAMWIALGDPRSGLWRHGGLINAFCRGQWRHPPVPPQSMASIRKQLDRLYLYRIQADYEARRLGADAAQMGLDTGKRVLRLVAKAAGLPL